MESRLAEVGRSWRRMAKLLQNQSIHSQSRRLTAEQSAEPAPAPNVASTVSFRFAATYLDLGIRWTWIVQVEADEREKSYDNPQIDCW